MIRFDEFNSMATSTTNHGDLTNSISSIHNYDDFQSQVQLDKFTTSVQQEHAFDLTIQKFNSMMTIEHERVIIQR